MTEKPTRASNVTIAAERELEAVRALIADLGTLAEDEQLRLDMIEGETSLHEILAQLITSIDDDAILIDGIKARQDELRARDSRLKRRIEVTRALIEKALTIADVKKLELPSATITLKAVAPKCVIVDEAKIPAAYWKRQDPKIDSRALLADLKDGPVPGAELSNGGQTVQIRRS